MTEQAANGTYGTASLKAIHSEITARLEEIDRISANCEFNGQYLMNDSLKDGIAIQVGTDGTATKSQIALAGTLFKSGAVADLFKDYGDINDASVAEVAKLCSGYDPATNKTTGTKPSAQLAAIDKVINEISNRVTTLGAAQNRIESAIESIGVQTENITSSLSTLRDADVAEESSNFIKAQILQQASATLLATANQTPSIALNLL